MMAVTHRRRVLLLPCLSALAASCGGAQNMMMPAGPAAAGIARLGWLVLGVFSVVSVLMWGLIFWSAARRQGSLLVHAPWNASEDRRWILIGGFTIPVLALATIFIVMLRTMSAFPMGDHEMRNMSSSIRVVGHQWWWEVEYLTPRTDMRVITANEIHIPAGVPVDIELASEDVIHSFWIPRLHGKVDLIPGTTTHLRLQADSPGAYQGQCAEYCGPQHAHMALLVVSEQAAAFDEWLGRLRSPAATPTDSDAVSGEQVFMTHQCALCHTVRGTPAQGLVGPDLTHFGGRTRLAANAFPNSTAPLSAWVTHAQSMKPNAQMPSMASFSGAELREMVAYLQGLK